jgi:hypothetical protein
MLYQTSKDGKGRASHYHIAYIRQDGTGGTSKARGHSHQIAIEGLENPQPVILPADDGHLHQLNMPMGGDVEKETKPDKKNETENELVGEVKALFKEALEYEAEFRKNGKESEGFYDGSAQWSKADKDALGKERASLTFNEIQPKINLLSGYQRQNRTDIRFYPTEEGDARVADILTHVVKNITERSNYDYEETLAFEDETIVGRGLIHPYVDYGDNVLGDIVIEDYPWDEGYFGPHNKMTLKDCEYMVKAKWLSWAKVKQMWPNKKDRIEAESATYLELMADESETHTNYAGDQYDQSANRVEVETDTLFVDLAKKEYRVLECWMKQYKRVYVLVNIEDGFYESAIDWNESDVKAIETIPGFNVIPRIKTDLRVVTIAGNVQLEDEIDKLYDGNFPVIPVYATKRKKTIFGKVEAGKDPQRESNKRISQMTDILNKVATYGHFYDDETFDNPQDESDFKRNVSAPGFLLKVNNVERPPKQAEGVKYPAELINMVAVATDKLREIMGINPEMMGLNTRAESGVAIAEKKRQGLVGNEYLFDNLSLAKRTLGRTLVKLIQKVYTPERIVRLLANRSAKHQIEIGGKDITEYTEEEILTVLKEADLTKYDVVVGESAYNVTTRHSNFVIWAEMAGKGFPVPPMLLVDLSDLPDKEKVKAEMQQMQQKEEQKEQQKMEVERYKVDKGQTPQGEGF